MLGHLAPLSLRALLLTLVLLFGLHGQQIMLQPLVILLLAVPSLIQIYFNVGLAYGLNRALGVEWCVAGPSALIGASNFAELAVATAIVLSGFQSGAALATVVGVLVDVPVMLSVVRPPLARLVRGRVMAGSRFAASLLRSLPTSSYRSRPCYAGIAEFSVYVAGHRRSAGAGQVAMTALREAAEAAGYWKLLSRIFPEIPPAERSWRRWDSMKSASIGGTESWTVCGETV